MSAHLGKVIGAAVVVGALVIFAIFFRPWGTKPSGECGQPPGPFYGSSANVELALQKSLAVFRGKAEPKVLDAIPAEARTLEMIGYLSCQARKQGLVSTNEELKEYTALLGDIARGNLIKRYVRHFGLLGALQTHLQKSPESNFTLRFGKNSSLLADFWVDEISARTWQEWFQKMCSNYAGCLVCEPTGTEIEHQVVVSPTERVGTVEISGEKHKGCLK